MLLFKDVFVNLDIFYSMIIINQKNVWNNVKIILHLTTINKNVYVKVEFLMEISV
jgi:hypothetical protein